MPTMVEDLKDLLRTLLARNRVGLLAAMPPRTLPRAPRAGPRSLEAEAEALLGELALLVVVAEDRSDRAVRGDRDHAEL